MTERTILDMALEALRPFATLFEVESPRWHRVPDDGPIIVGPKATLTVGDLRRAAAAVEAIEKMKGDAAPPPPPGDMVLVPREATEGMKTAAMSAMQKIGARVLEPGDCAKVYKAMLAASPLPTQEVSDAMVEGFIKTVSERVVQRGGKTFEEYCDSKQQEQTRADIRAALESALRTGERKE